MQKTQHKVGHFAVQLGGLELQESCLYFCDNQGKYWLLATAARPSPGCFAVGLLCFGCWSLLVLQVSWFFQRKGQGKRGGGGLRGWSECSSCL